MTPALSFLANHLWQSTLFAVVAGLLTLAFRNNRAHVRYWLWLTASIKFLVPFAVLMAIGGQIGRWVPVRFVEHADATFIVTTLNPQTAAGPGASQLLLGSAPPVAAFPSVPASVWLTLVVLWGLGAGVVAAMWCIRWRRVAATVRAAVRVEHGRELDALRRLERVGNIGTCTELVSSHAPVEPGVFGIVRPVLLWPRSIAEHLSDSQIDAILAHELSHVRRRDNLTAAVHMAVQAIFWFHPLVWWIGARLVEERERACDEDVVRLGNAPHVYAESILKACQFYVESPLVCVAGVTGTDLKRRIEHIMRSDPASLLSGWKKLLLATAGIAAVAAPVVVGAVNAPSRMTSAPHIFETRRMIFRVRSAGQSSAQAVDGPPPAFEVASIKANKSGSRRVNLAVQPGGRFVATNVSLQTLIAIAHETRELPMYALVMAQADGRFGPRLRRSDVDCSDPQNVPPPAASGTPSCGFRSVPGKATGRATMSVLARWLNGAVDDHRPVEDRTDLAGTFEFDLDWTPERPLPPGAPALPPVDPNGPGLFTALKEQLGLSLESQKDHVDILVVDRAEHPSEN